MKSEIKDYIQKNGNLYSLGKYLSLNPKNSEACLDGDFTLEELKDIVDYWETNVN